MKRFLDPIQQLLFSTTGRLAYRSEVPLQAGTTRILGCNVESCVARASARRSCPGGFECSAVDSAIAFGISQRCAVTIEISCHGNNSGQIRSLRSWHALDALAGLYTSVLPNATMVYSDLRATMGSARMTRRAGT